MVHESAWRKSSFSGGGSASGGNCVEAAVLPDGRIAFRDSKNPGSVVLFGRADMSAWAQTWFAKIKTGS